MRISTKIIGGMLCVALLPMTVTSVSGYFIARDASIRSGKVGTDYLLQAEYERLGQVAADKAAIVEGLLGAYHDDVDQFAEEVSGSFSEWPFRINTRLTDLYAGFDTAGLPAYGYVDREWRSFANWDLRGYGGSSWIRRSVVEEARRDPALQSILSRNLRVLMSLAPLMEGIYRRHEESCELVWAVTLAGVIASFPNDYGARLKANPGFNELDESGADYVANFSPDRNPGRESRWMEPYLDPVKRVWMTSCVAPVFDGNNFTGTVGMDLLLTHLAALLQESNIGKDGYAFLLSASGQAFAITKRGIEDLCWTQAQRDGLSRIATSGGILEVADSDGLGHDLSAASMRLTAHPDGELARIFGDMTRGGAGSSLVRLGGVDKILAWAPVQEAGWSIGLVRPSTEASAAIDAAMAASGKVLDKGAITFLAVFFALGLVAVSIGALLGLLFVRPLRRLTAAVRAISETGEWRRVPVESGDEIGILASSVNRMVCAIAADEEMLRGILESLNEAIFLHDARTGEILRVNRHMTELWGYGQDEARRIGMVGLSLGDAPYGAPEAAAWIERARRGEKPVFEWIAKRRDGGLFCIEVRMSAITVGGKDYVIAAVRNIEERKAAASRIERALREKEALLRELHHRTKNNMQVICALLSLEAGQNRNESVRSSFEEMANRINAMAMVHEKLYRSRELSRINLAEYIQDFATLLSGSFAGEAIAPRLVFDLELLEVEIDVAIPCGLIVNELITNAFKHAFMPGTDGAEIRIGLGRSSPSSAELTIADNGRGFPEGHDPRDSGRMGLQTVVALVSQLKGSAEFSGSAGCSFRLRFPLPTVSLDGVA